MPSYTVKKGDTLSKISKDQGLNLNDLKIANQGIDYNKLKIGQQLNLPSSAINTSKATPKTNTYQSGDIYLLSALAAIEGADDPQSMADVAQSVYNRTASKGYDNTIRDVILKDYQYQPLFEDPNVNRSKTGAIWKKVKDEQSAIDAMTDYFTKRGYSVTQNQIKNKLYNAVNSITDPSLQLNSINFVQSNTDFRGYNPPQKQGRSTPVWRGTKKHNRFFSDKPAWTVQGDIPEQLRIYSNQPDEPMVDNELAYMFRPR